MSPTEKTISCWAPKSQNNPERHIKIDFSWMCILQSVYGKDENFLVDLKFLATSEKYH